MLAQIRFWLEWRWHDAEQEFRRALELNPVYVDAYSHFAAFLGYMGRRDEALAQVARARELDPLDAHAASAEALIHLVGRRYEEAISVCRQMLDLQPDSRLPLLALGLSNLACSRPDEAVEPLCKLPTHGGYAELGLGLAGKTANAQRLLAERTERSQREYVAPCSFALTHLGLGQLDQSLDYVEKAYDERSPFLVHLQEPYWDALRDHPRFRDIHRRVGLPELSRGVVTGDGRGAR